MNRYENPPELQARKPSFSSRLLAPFAPVLGVVLGAGLLGRMRGADWMDQPIRAFVALHLTGLGMDLYTMAVARRLRRQGAPVVIPYAAPALFGIVRLLLYGACQAKLAAPGALYTISSTGFMLPRTGPVLLIAGFGLISLALVIYEGVILRMALCPSPEKLRRAEAPPADMPVGPEYVYEVQTILGALGYYGGPVDGALSEGVKEAIRRFQGEAGLMAHGGLTAATVIELRKRWEAHQVRAIRRPAEGMERKNGRGVWMRMRDWMR